MAQLDYNNKSVTLDDIVFEERNKAYGAYWLRKHYDDFVIRGLIIGALAFSTAVAGPMLYDRFKPAPEPEPEENIVEVALSTPPPPPPPTEIPPPPPLPAAPPPPQVTTIKFPPPEIVKEEVPDDPPKQEELKEAAIGQETVKGDENAPVFENIEVQGSPGGTGDFVAEEEPKEYLIVEQQPAPPYDFNAYLQKNLRYPTQATSNEIQGIVYMNFQVGADGVIRDIQVTKGLGYGCDEEATRVLSKMPAWNPGKQGGRPVPVRYKIPIRFRLQ